MFAVKIDKYMIDKYLVAGCCFAIEGEDLPLAVRRIGGFRPFYTQESEAEFSVQQVELTIVPELGEKLYELFHDDSWIHFYKCEGGHIMRLSKFEEVAFVWQDESGIYYSGSLEPQLLRFALWIAYGLATIGKRRIAIHSSCIVCKERAYLFLGESGTGKSTHTRLWREHIAGAVLLNDDSPIISVEEDGVWVYGSPWSGKTPCFKQERYLLGGCVRLSQAPYNKISKLPVIAAFAALHPSCPPEFALDELYDNISHTLNLMLKAGTKVWHLECLPDADAARLSFETLSRGY